MFVSSLPMREDDIFLINDFFNTKTTNKENELLDEVTNFEQMRSGWLDEVVGRRRPKKE